MYIKNQMKFFIESKIYLLNERNSLQKMFMDINKILWFGIKFKRRANLKKKQGMEHVKWKGIEYDDVYLMDDCSMAYMLIEKLR